MARRMFAHLGQSALECVLLPKIQQKLGSEMNPVCFSQGSLECLMAARARGKGVLFVTAHVGNWELMAAEVARHARVAVLAKPSYDNRFTNMISAFRENHGVQSIDVTRSGHLLAAKRVLKQGDVLGVLLDQPVENGQRLPFLGQLAPTSIVAAALARWTGASVLGGFIYRHKDGRHTIYVSEIKEKRESCWASCSMRQSSREGVRQRDIAATRSFTEAIEQAILRHPEQWIWSLDRWRSTESRKLSRHNANVVPSPGN